MGPKKAFTCLLVAAALCIVVYGIWRSNQAEASYKIVSASERTATISSAAEGSSPLVLVKNFEDLEDLRAKKGEKRVLGNVVVADTGWTVPDPNRPIPRSSIPPGRCEGKILEGKVCVADRYPYRNISRLTYTGIRPNGQIVYYDYFPRRWRE